MGWIQISPVIRTPLFLGSGGLGSTIAFVQFKGPAACNDVSSNISETDRKVGEH